MASTLDDALTLRAQAEARFSLKAAKLPAMGNFADAAQLLHELQVHQIELEMQNDELRRTLVALDTSQARYFDFYDLAPVGYCSVNEQGQISQANLTTARLLGHERSALLTQLFSRFITRDAQDDWYQFLQRQQASREPGSIELHMARADGTPFWAELAALAVPDPNGGSALRVVLTDITQRKAANEKLELAACVFSHSGEGIIITDAQANITEVNEAFTHLSGYSRAEVVGKNPRLLSSGLQSQAFYAAMWADLRTKGNWSGELTNRHKDGSLYAVLLSISVVHGPQGEVQRYVALFSDISAARAHASQLLHMAHFDSLTNLPNRLLLTDRLQQAMLQVRRSGHPLAVVFLDLDGFKTINDTYGHAAGDSLLMALAKGMQGALREGDTLARIGGDEFAAVLNNLASMAACLPLLARLLKAAAEPLLLDGKRLQVSASLGVTFFPQAEDLEEGQLMRQADQAMYQAKQEGKNRYHVFDTVQDTSLRTWHEDIYRQGQALGQHEYVLYYQPKVNLRTGQVVGVEALIRWQHPSKGLLAPALFLPTIENHDLAIQVGEWVIDTALGQIAQWQAQGLDLPVSVNVGASQLQQANFVERLQALLARHPQVSPTHLELEILETSALQDMTYVSKVIEDCALMGVAFALDDFGTGYSSLTYLKRLRVALLKIDQSFVRNMLVDHDDRAILEGVIGLARAFKRQVIAEGVETTAHGALLLQLGCDLAQGFGIARPMPAHEVPGWLVQWQQDGAWRALTGV
jgi:diguanylate cyclase (GGDEF)-like protein/PAS domain S-box-containing protein